MAQNQTTVPEDEDQDKELLFNHACQSTNPEAEFKNAKWIVVTSPVPHLPASDQKTVNGVKLRSIEAEADARASKKDELLSQLN